MPESPGSKPAIRGGHPWQCVYALRPHRPPSWLSLVRVSFALLVFVSRSFAPTAPPPPLSASVRVSFVGSFAAWRGVRPIVRVSFAAQAASPTSHFIAAKYNMLARAWRNGSQ
jgi:hypothetical protein